ncbi:lytic transglycosylase, catalytic [Treponema primitia ZAS-2]|uniref:Lytic transglycosylase, catalytic n=1 Tax=Treponema primitia (strain ATCC BAA-887 / DSM 12427 / ZAS-2) TaxID=545694 RepID=F5YP79_TREPZ|nr:lytic transglycosylase, catalytic [Treponema primitia ZAS-2]
MGLSRNEAGRRLKEGDIDFILDKAPYRMEEIGLIHPSAPYYAGMLVKARAGELPADGALLATPTLVGKFPAQALPEHGTQALAEALFEAALDGKGKIQREAARELMGPLLAKDPGAAGSFLDRLEQRPPSVLLAPDVLVLRGAALYKLGRYDEAAALFEGRDGDEGAGWDRAFALLSALEAKNWGAGAKEELTTFFLSRAPGEAQQWAQGELGDRLQELLGPARAAAVRGRFALAGWAYGQGLGYFREALAGEEDLFFRYPDMLGDLGRAFLYGPGRSQGLELLLGWDRSLREASAGKDWDIRGLRYRILYYAGRIQRQSGQYADAAKSFDSALEFAPDGLQRDACIWYILSMGFQEQPGETVALLRKYLPRWHSPVYFEDIMDRLARYLTVNRRWDTLAELFSLIRDSRDGGTVAKYAYILGRALSEGFLPAASAPMKAEELFRIAFEQEKGSFYYRALAASRLGRTTVPVPEKAEAPGKGPDFGEDAEFILGFFEYGLGGLAFSYLGDTTEFSPEELRAMAGAFAGAGLWAESIRVVSAYMGREDFGVTRQDLELYYPRAFTDMVETRAKETEIPAELLFALVRTESAFVPEIRSQAGAVGLTQLMPATALDMAGRIRRQGGTDYLEEGKINLEDPKTNIHLGAVYLAYLEDRMESPMFALLAYNGGMGRVRNWRRSAPALPGDLFLETIEYPETREYGRKVLAAAAAYGYLYYGMTMEAVVADIYR